MRLGLLSYFGSRNLGDAIQTVAMQQLVPQADFFVLRQELKDFKPDNSHLIINGYMREPLPPSGCSYVGLYFENGWTEKFKTALEGKHVGARDPYTYKLLKKQGVQTSLIGCATATLPPYNGPRSGLYSIDYSEKGFKQLSNYIDPGTSWDEQLTKAIALLGKLRTAEKVITSRLHIALPCLAMHTPVCIPWSVFRWIGEPARLSILDEMGFQYGKFNTLNLNPWVTTYKSFLNGQLHSL